jgi:hypothetical protein
VRISESAGVTALMDAAAYQALVDSEAK